MITKTINLYLYSELNDEAKEKAVQWWLEGLEGWHDSIYDNTNQIGLEIQSFDIYRNDIDGELIKPMPEIIASIKENHGQECATYNLALEFEKKLQAIPDDENQASEEAIQEIENDFKNALLAEYLKMLRAELDFQESPEAIAEAMEANEYTFEADGTRRD